MHLLAAPLCPTDQTATAGDSAPHGPHKQWLAFTQHPASQAGQPHLLTDQAAPTVQTKLAFPFYSLFQCVPCLLVVPNHVNNSDKNSVS